MSLNIQNANTGQNIPSTMHGLILETNINRDDDGGIYAELIYNRAFQGKNNRFRGLYLVFVLFRTWKIIGWLVDIWTR